MDEMTELESSLRQALRHVPAPEGFAGRVMARVAAEGAHTASSAGGGRPAGMLLHMRPAAAWGTAVAAALLLAVGGGNAMHLHHERQREQAAQQEVDLAMQLTNHALNEVEVNLHRSHAGKFTQLWNESLQ